MHELALFAGAGGGLLATKWLLGFRTICYVENNPYRVKVLKARIRDGYLDDAPIWGDVRTFDGTPWCGVVDCITAGFPCQPFSQAGKGLAERDERNRWPDTIRIIREVRPEWILLENVPRLLSYAYVGQIFGDLVEGGYDCRWDCVPASAVGANHQRDRLWIVAHAASSGRNGSLPAQRQETRRSESDGSAGQLGRPSTEVAHAESQREVSIQQPRQRHGFEQGRQDVAHTAIAGEWGLPIRQGRQEQEKTHLDGSRQDVAHADGQGLLQPRTDGGRQEHTIAQSRRDWGSWWDVEPDVGRVVDGCPNRVDRVAAIGDMQIPAVVAVVWRMLTKRRIA